MKKILRLKDFAETLKSPDCDRNLTIGMNELTDGENKYPLIKELPILLPAKLQPFIKNGRIEIPMDQALEKFVQYFLISSIKQNHPTINSDHNDYWYKRHMDNCKRLYGHCNDGLLLDIGCDTPSININLHSKDISYVGLDPSFTITDEFRVIGIAELLPFKDSTFDNVLMMSSLDHVLDYHKAIDEAYRVLKPGGKLLFSSLIWTKRAELFNDTNHFHHFRENQLMTVLENFKISYLFKDVWKDNDHRESLYLCAVKDS